MSSPLRNHPIVEKAGETVEYTRYYVQQQIALAKLEVAERGTVILSGLVAGIAVGTLALIGFCFALVALALLIAAWLDSYIIGFGAVAVLLLLIAAILHIYRQSLIADPFSQLFINKLFNDEAPPQD